MRRNGFADESAKGGQYAVAVALVPASDVAAVRTIARGLRKPGTNRIHMIKEREPYREQVLRAVIACGHVSAWIAHGKGKEADVRAACMRALVGDLHLLGLDRLVLESREGRDGQDRQVLGGCGLAHHHLAASTDPALWLADVLAWSFTHGGSRRAMVEGIALSVHDVGVA